MAVGPKRARKVFDTTATPLSAGMQLSQFMPLVVVLFTCSAVHRLEVIERNMPYEEWLPRPIKFDRYTRSSSHSFKQLVCRVAAQDAGKARAKIGLVALAGVHLNAEAGRAGYAVTHECFTAQMV